MSKTFILGSHNSLSYLPIKNKWNLFMRCQNHTLNEQYNLGVRLFDIKVRYNGKIQFCCGNTVFDYTESQFYEDVRHFGGEAYFKFTLDMKNKPEISTLIKQFFFDFIVDFSHTFRNIVTIVGVYILWEHKDYTMELSGQYVEDFLCKTNSLNIYNKYSTKSKTIFKYLPPKWFANIVNEQIMDLITITPNSKQAILIDYVK